MLSARDANGCFSQVSFNIPGQVPLETEILGPTIVQIGNEATHLLNLPNGQNFTIDSIVWSINGTVVCNSPNCVSITQSHPLGQNAITVTVYYNSGCIVIDTYAFLVTELYETEFPNIIYTNSGALNNTFKISTSDPSLFVEKMRIYDRWGNLVFKQENFSAFTDPVGWAGDFGDGRKVEQGVYVYIFEMRSDNESKIIESGDVTVIR